MSVVLECWNIALTSGYMLVRTGYLIIASAMYIGRIDRPFLTEEAATFGPIREYTPIAFLFYSFLVCH
jgi:hypothetical protein